MLTVDGYAQIREARRDGASVRELAQRFRRSPTTILEVLSNAQPKPYTLTKPRPAPVFDAVRPIVDDILARDQGAPPKQRHTAAQIFRRLGAEHGYAGSYLPIQRYLQRRRLDRRDTFIPLEHAPGHARCYARGQKVLDPVHFLGTVERKPAALDHAPVYRDWPLPPAFAELRAALVARLGSCVGNRHYIRVLQLRATRPAERLALVIAGRVTRDELGATTIAAAARQLLGGAPAPSDNALSLGLAAATVRPADLAQLDRLLPRSSPEGDDDVRRGDRAVTQGQPEAPEVADDAVRVGEAGP